MDWMLGRIGTLHLYPSNEDIYGGWWPSPGSPLHRLREGHAVEQSDASHLTTNVHVLNGVVCMDGDGVIFKTDGALVNADGEDGVVRDARFREGAHSVQSEAHAFSESPRVSNPRAVRRQADSDEHPYGDLRTFSLSLEYILQSVSYSDTLSQLGEPAGVKVVSKSTASTNQIFNSRTCLNTFSKSI